MSTYKYQIVKNGVVTNEWTSAVFGDDHYSPSFGLPGTYTLVTTDITEEIRNTEIAKRISEIEAETESKVQAILAPMEKPTYLMLALHDVCVASNASGTETQSNIIASKSRIHLYKAVMFQIQELRSERDKKVSDYIKSVGVDP